MPALLTIEEAAATLRVSPFTVRRMLKEGRLRGVQLRGPGSTLRLSVTELRALIDERDDKPNEER